MSAYKRKDRGGAWWYQYRLTLPNGKKTRIKGKPAINTQKAAEDAEREHINRLLHPERYVEPDPQPASPKAGSFPTIREFAITFLKEYDPTGANSSRKSRRSIVNGSIVKLLGHVRLDQINQSHVNGFIAVAGKTASTINNKLTVLSTLLQYAVDIYKGALSVPRLKLRVSRKASKKAAVKIRAIDRSSELPKLLHAVRGDQRFVVVMLLASDAGLRIGEIRGLMWTDIIFKGEGAIHIRRSIDSENVEGPPKNGKQRLIPGLTPELRAALLALPKRGLWVLTPLPRDHDALLSTRSLGYRGMLTKVKRAYRDAGIELATGDDVDPFHSIRHTFGTELAARNVPVTVIMELMGHSDITTTQRYVTTRDDQMRAAMRSLSST